MGGRGVLGKFAGKAAGRGELVGAGECLHDTQRQRCGLVEGLGLQKVAYRLHAIGKIMAGVGGAPKAITACPGMNLPACCLVQTRARA